MSNNRSSKSTNPSTAKLSQQIIEQASGWTESGSYYEEKIREKAIARLVEMLLDTGHDDDLNTILNTLDRRGIDAGMVILEQVHHLCQYQTVELDGNTFECLMMAAPILAWTRYRIPQTNLTAAQLRSMTQALESTILSPGVHAHCLSSLYSSTELPMSYTKIRTLLRKLVQKLVLGKKASLPFNDYPEGFEPLADYRTLIFIAVAPQGQPIMRWLFDSSTSREDCLERWQSHVMEILADHFAGCKLEVLLPDAFLNSVHEADEKIRPLNIHASVNWLHHTLEVPMHDLCASIMGFGDQDEIKEYRIGYTSKSSSEVIFGTIWPVFDTDIDTPDHGSRWPTPESDGKMADDQVLQHNLNQIVQTLKDAGVQDIRLFHEISPREYCDDCSAPLFPNTKGEVVHPELPDESFGSSPNKFH